MSGEGRGEDWGRGMFFYKSAESALSARRADCGDITRPSIQTEQGRLLIRTIGHPTLDDVMACSLFLVIALNS